MPHFNLSPAQARALIRLFDAHGDRYCASHPDERLSLTAAIPKLEAHAQKEAERVRCRKAAKRLFKGGQS